MFVIFFPILFYIPKFFEVHSHYETKEVKMEIDCGKYMKLGKMLNNTQLRDHIIRSISEEELARVELLATACKIIIDKERDQLAQMQNFTATNETIMKKIVEIAINNDVHSMEREDDETSSSMNRTITTMSNTTTRQRRKQRRYTRDNKGKRIKAKKLKKVVRLPFLR